ncbi:MAG: hypothetical protein ACJA2C_000755 [Marinoscillum sp.]|jgi:hypothetical protein
MKIMSSLFRKATFSVIILASFPGIEGCKDSNDTPEPDIVEAEVVDLTHLPFGGDNILRRDKGISQPALESLWLCGVPSDGAGNSDASDWTNEDGTWDYTRKPQVEGSLTWLSEFEILLDGKGNRLITGNSLPGHPTGVFPIDPNSIAYQYDRNTNGIQAHDILFTLPEMPEEAASSSCVTYGAAGISLSGSVIYHGASTLGNDAAVHELFDSYGGHSDGTNTYHYHYPAENLQKHIHPEEEGHSGLMGYMIDGFGIYGPRGEDGKVLWSKDLDECHGHSHPVLWDGEMVDLYHYHWTYDFPYNIGCFKGTPQ